MKVLGDKYYSVVVQDEGVDYLQAIYVTLNDSNFYEC